MIIPAVRPSSTPRPGLTLVGIERGRHRRRRGVLGCYVLLEGAPPLVAIATETGGRRGDREKKGRREQQRCERQTHRLMSISIEVVLCLWLFGCAIGGGRGEGMRNMYHVRFELRWYDKGWTDVCRTEVTISAQAITKGSSERLFELPRNMNRTMEHVTHNNTHPSPLEKSAQQFFTYHCRRPRS